MSDNKEWLQSLKAGDEVAVRTGGWGNTYAFKVISRITATQIVFTYGEFADRFDRADGYERGAGRHRRQLVPATAALKAEIATEQRHSWMVARLDRQKWKNVDDAVLEQIVALLPPEPNKE